MGRLLKSAMLASSLLLSVLVIAQAQGNPPIILRVDFPATVLLGGSASGSVQFRDPDGDLSLARFTPLEVGPGPIAVKPESPGVTEGSVIFQLQCGILPVRITMKVTLFDAAGHRSTPVAFAYDCGKPPSREGYDREQQAVRSIKARVRVNFFILEDDATELAEEAKFEAATAVFAEPQPVIPTALQEVMLPDVVGLWDQCGIGFELGVVRVVRPRNVALSAQTTLDSIFVEAKEGRIILDTGKALDALAAAIPTLNEALKKQGKEIAKDDRNVFFVGRSLGGGINAGVAEIIGRVAIVRWASIWVDPVSNEIFKPKRIIKTIAHELGHTLGLRDIGTAEALMNPTNGLAGWALSAEECGIAEKGLTLPPF